MKVVYTVSSLAEQTTPGALAVEDGDVSVSSVDLVDRGFSGTSRMRSVYPFSESDTLFLECFFLVVFECLAILRIEGCLNRSLSQNS